MTEEMKIKLFEKMYELEKKAEENDISRNLNRCRGAYQMLIAVGLNDEYWQWAEQQ